MKKFLSSICILILTFALCISASGCFNFIKDNGNISDIPNASTAGQSVSFGTLFSSVDDADRKKLEIEDAVALVERSAVAIRMQNSAASGVLVSLASESINNKANELYIITCFHVIESKGYINVLIPDKNFSYENNDFIYGGVIGDDSAQSVLFGTSATIDNAVTLIGGDKSSDIAVLKLNLSKKSASGKVHSASEFVTAKLPPADYSPRRGESVFAIGNPTGVLPGSICSGVISYLERETQMEEIGTMILMQIDATINPGNSGGGLYNRYGELIGITNGGNTSYEAINFAIPMHVQMNNSPYGFVDIAKQLIGSYNKLNEKGFKNYGYVDNRRELMGFTVSPKEIDKVEYVNVVAVTEGSQANKKGLVVNDLIVEILIKNQDGNFVSKSFTGYEQFTSIMKSLEMSAQFKLKVRRSNGYWHSDKVIGDNEPFEIRQFIFCDTGVYK